MICTILMSTSTDMKPPYPGPEGPKDTQQITRTPPIVGMICTILMSTSTDTQPPYPGPKGPKDTQQITYTPQLLAWYIQYQCKHQMLACLVLNCPFFITVPNCPRCQIVRFSLRCQIVRGAKLSAVPNCPTIIITPTIEKSFLQGEGGQKYSVCTKRKNIDTHSCHRLWRPSTMVRNSTYAVLSRLMRALSVVG